MARDSGAVALGDVALHYETLGAGEPIVLLAGGPGHSASYFEALAESLAGSHRVILLDQRGTGGSALARVDAETVSFERFVADLEAVRAHFGFDRWALLGHSWGGVLAMGYAASHPDRVERMILVGSGGPNADYLRWYGANIGVRLSPEEREAIAFWQAPERLGKDPARALGEVSRLIAPAMVCDRALALDLCERLLVPGEFNPSVLLAMQPFLASGYDFRPQLRGVGARVLVVQGRQDPIGESTAFQIRDALPGATLRFVEESAHWPFVEQEEAFLAIVREFLTQRG
jgi:proline iminopeptidase